MECMTFDCSWGAQLCDPNHCSNPTLKGPACGTTAKTNTAARTPPKKNKNYMGIEQLTPPAMHDRNIKHHVLWQNAHGRFLNLSYNAALTKEPIFAIDSEGIQSVSCGDDGTLNIKPDLLSDRILSRLQAAKLIAGGHHWQCQINNARIILRRIVNVTVSGSVLQVRTDTATYADFFEHAELSFSTNHLPKPIVLEAGSKDPAHRAAFEKQQEVFEAEMEGERRRWRPRRRLLWGFIKGVTHAIGSALSATWHAVKRIGQEVTNVVMTVVKVVKLIVTGDYDYNKELDLAVIA